MAGQRLDVRDVQKRLTGVRSDVEQLLKDMDEAFKAYGQPVRLAWKGDEPTQRVLVRVKEVMPIPPEWNRRVGHVLYDVRSSLDHLVHALARASATGHLDAKARGRLQFPICTTRSAWDEELQKHRLDGLEPRYVEVIRRHQPFRASRKARQVLAQLQRFGNADKHRGPAVIMFAAETFRIEFGEGPACELRDVEPFSLAGTLRVGTKVAYVHFTRRPGVDERATCVRSRARGTVYPALSGGVRLDVFLQYLLIEADRILDECERA